MSSESAAADSGRPHYLCGNCLKRLEPQPAELPLGLVFCSSACEQESQEKAERRQRQAERCAVRQTIRAELETIQQDTTLDYRPFVRRLLRARRLDERNVAVYADWLQFIDSVSGVINRAAMECGQYPPHEAVSIGAEVEMRLSEIREGLSWRLHLDRKPLRGGRPVVWGANVVNTLEDIEGTIRTVFMNLGRLRPMDNVGRYVTLLAAYAGVIDMEDNAEEILRQRLNRATEAKARSRFPRT